jgi:hypothetical protein
MLVKESLERADIAGLYRPDDGRGDRILAASRGVAGLRVGFGGTPVGAAFISTIFPSRMVTTM